MRNRCNTCRGEYDTVSSDGSSYFHACPPEVVITIERSGGVLEVPIADVRPDDVVTVQRGTTSTKLAMSAVLLDDIRLGERSRPRAEARNENIDPRARPGGRAILAEGRGATTIRP